MIRVDRELLARAKAELGIEQPVRIEFAARPPDGDLPPITVEPGDELVFGGCHYRENGKHFVTLGRRNMTPERWTYGLLHELTHCAQHEQFATDDEGDRAYAYLTETHGYEDNPMEVQANATAARLLPRYRGLVYEEER